MKITDAIYLALKNKKGQIYLKSDPKVILDIDKLCSEWCYDKILSENTQDNYHKIAWERYHCRDLPPIMMNLIRSISI